MKTTPTLLEAFFLALTVILTITACEKENGDDIPVEEVKDTVAPQQLKDLVATPQNQAVLLEWTNPSDEDFNSTRILFRDTSLLFTKDIDSVVISNLTNDQEYTFELYAQDINGNKAEGVIAKATPDQYVTVVKGNEVELGTYVLPNASPYQEQVITENTFIFYYGNSYIHEATIQKKNDTTWLFDHASYAIENNEKTLLESYFRETNAMFNYYFDHNTYLYRYAYKKIEGKPGMLTGKYKYYYKRINDDNPNSAYTKTSYYEFLESGEYKQYRNTDDEPNIGQWTNEDLLSNNYMFFKHNSQTYLINRKSTEFFIKHKER